MADLLDVPHGRARELRGIGERLLGARSVVLTTHLNADGDGAGSEAAVAAWLESRGVRATIVNPTPFPSAFRFLLHRQDVVADLGDAAAEAALRDADLFLVLDTSEANRVRPLLDWLDPARTMVVDHHPPGPTVVGAQGVQDPAAAATGELVFDLLRLMGGDPPTEVTAAMYVALVSDTGSFRFSNTTPRVHLIAAELLRGGVDPEQIYQKLYATAPRRRLDLLREALATLETDSERGLTWMVVPSEVEQRLRTESEDYEGLVDQARSVEGTRVAILFRELPQGHTKMSFRSNGEVDVNRIARDFGGGGHAKAAGALVEAPAASAVPRVLERVRRSLAEGG